MIKNRNKEGALLVGIFTLLLAANGISGQKIKTCEAVYLGVENYGADDVNKDTKDLFSYRFEVAGKERSFRMYNGTKDDAGSFGYPLQNRMKEGYTYDVQIQNQTVIGLEEKADAVAVAYDPPVQGTPGLCTLKNFLATAMMPVGTTLYVYGGGWDWQDAGSAEQARTIGVSEDWVRFFQSQDENYTYRDRDGDESKKDAANSYYPYGGFNEYYYAGLDCSGFVGWTLYNVMNTEDGKDGFVMSSTKMAKRLAENGWGTLQRDIKAPQGHGDSMFLPGDVFSISGHVWICMGTCEDGSILILHSTPAPSRTGQPGGGVELSAIGTDESCDAYRLADTYMSRYYPQWYERYPVALKDFTQYTSTENENAGRFTWNLTGADGGLTDPDGYQGMAPEEILADLFN